MGATTNASFTVTPIEAAAAIVDAAIAIGVAPPSLTGEGAGGSTSATAAMRGPRHPPVQ
jgi:hypothetical protein